MDLTINNPKTTEVESPTNHQIQKPKPFSFSSNGVLKRKNHHLDHQQHHPVVVIYKECLKNHAANIGGHAVDGCGEFMPSPTANSTDPTSLKCAACGCHRNFHRRETDQDMALQKAVAIEYQPLHRHHPPPPPPPPPVGTSSPNNSPSPPPISSAYYPSSAPHMLLALSTGYSGEKNQNPSPNSNGRKRFRTKFTPDQKAKMQEFAEQVGWKMQKRDEDLVSKFCNEIGVEKSVLKVWMHNNKNSFGKKSDQDEVHDILNNNGNTNTDATDVNGFCIVSRNNASNNYENKKDVDSHSQVHVVTTNGSSTSS